MAVRRKKFPVAHIVTPAHRLADAKRGLPVEGLCGAAVTGDPVGEAGLCVACAKAQWAKDDADFDERSQHRYDAGRASALRDVDATRARHERELELARLEERRMMETNLGKFVHQALFGVPE